MKIPQKRARRIALNCQLLDGRTKIPKGYKGALTVIRELGYIQIDTISVVERAHHHTLRTRCPDYKPEHLDRLQSRDRAVFEYWGHQASYLPIQDYRFYLPIMKSFCDPVDKWARGRLEKCGHLMKPVLKRIRDEGPLSSKDFESGNRKSGNWWDWKPAKIALELLFWQGELMITRRNNFNRVYDLTERVLPDNIDTSVPTDDERGDFLVRRALNAYGVATAKEIQCHLQDFFRANNPVIVDSLKRMVESGEVLEVEIENIPGKPMYGLKAIIEKGMKLRARKASVFILSPFDNLIINRDRVRNLFDFEYSLECYLPASKRKYGYFVLPLLFGEEFAGRMDAKADRLKKTLIIRKLTLEKGFKDDLEFLSGLKKALAEFCNFNGCSKIDITDVSSRSLGKEII